MKWNSFRFPFVTDLASNADAVLNWNRSSRRRGIACSVTEPDNGSDEKVLSLGISSLSLTDIKLHKLEFDEMKTFDLN